MKILKNTGSFTINKKETFEEIKKSTSLRSLLLILALLLCCELTIAGDLLAFPPTTVAETKRIDFSQVSIAFSIGSFADWLEETGSSNLNTVSRRAEWSTGLSSIPLSQFNAQLRDYERIRELVNKSEHNGTINLTARQTQVQSRFYQDWLIENDRAYRMLTDETFDTGLIENMNISGDDSSVQFYSNQKGINITRPLTDDSDQLKILSALLELIEDTHIPAIIVMDEESGRLGLFYHQSQHLISLSTIDSQQSLKDIRSALIKTMIEASKKIENYVRTLPAADLLAQGEDLNNLRPDVVISSLSEVTPAQFQSGLVDFEKSADATLLSAEDILSYQGEKAKLFSLSSLGHSVSGFQASELNLTLKAHAAGDLNIEFTRPSYMNIAEAILTSPTQELIRLFVPSFESELGPNGRELFVQVRKGSRTRRLEEVIYAVSAYLERNRNSQLEDAISKTLEFMGINFELVPRGRNNTQFVGRENAQSTLVTISNYRNEEWHLESTSAVRAHALTAIISTIQNSASSELVLPRDFGSTREMSIQENEIFVLDLKSNKQKPLHEFMKVLENRTGIRRIDERRILRKAEVYRIVFETYQWLLEDFYSHHWIKLVAPSCSAVLKP